MKELARINVSKPYKKRRLKNDPEHREERREYKIKHRNPSVRRKEALKDKIYRRKNRTALKRRAEFVRDHSSTPPLFASLAAYSELQKVLFTTVESEGGVPSEGMVDTQHLFNQVMSQYDQDIESPKDGIHRDLISEEWVTPDFQLRNEVWTLAFDPSHPVDITSFYTKDGTFIGDEKDGRFFIEKGIVPERADPSHSVCSIGYCESESKWYGWSHRAMKGFAIGDKYHSKGMAWPNPSNPVDSDRVCTTEAECKESACNFADDVS